MLSLMEQTGAKGNVNFDVVGYEQLAITDPEAFDALKQAIHDGRAEMVGASYGQPYGLFCGGEANVRQLVMGVLVCEKLFGVCAPSPGGKRSSTSSRSYANPARMRVPVRLSLLPVDLAHATHPH